MREEAPGFAEFGVEAFTTLRDEGSYRLTGGGDTPWERWIALAAQLSPKTPRLAFAHQVHGSTVHTHAPTWTGLLRVSEGDGHVAFHGATAMAVTVADCVPVFLAHPSGAAGIVHSGWKGTAARIAPAAVALFQAHGLAPSDLIAHCGPSVCGACYEVSPDVVRQLTGANAGHPSCVDLRSIIAAQLAAMGIRSITQSTLCTKHDNDKFFSHRMGDEGRQVGVIVSAAKG